MTDTTTRREAQIDGELAGLWSEANALRAKLETNRDSIARSLKIRGQYVGRSHALVYPPIGELLPKAEEMLADESACSWDRKALADTLAKRRELETALAACRAKAEPLEAIYNREQWSRFFIVQNTDGHIHSSMNCSTCHPTTSFGWLPELSGLGEADAVAAHGALLCTVCFPTAPVEWTNQRELEAAAREAEKAATECPGSRTWDHDSSGLRYASPRAKCNHCHTTVSVTSTGKLRGHKKPVAS